MFDKYVISILCAAAILAAIFLLMKIGNFAITPIEELSVLYNNGIPLGY